MAFGNGHHRNVSFGGEQGRNPGEVFASAFQGKLAEFAFYEETLKYDLNMPEPDLLIYGEGEWDEADFVIQNSNIAIKSTKSNGNLLLLEHSMWDQNAIYTPSNTAYDYFVLVRLNPVPESILKRNRKLYSQFIDKTELKNMLSDNYWTYDIPGYASKDQMKEAMAHQSIYRDEQIRGRNSQLTRIQVDNYYLQSVDLKPINEFNREFA